VRIALNLKGIAHEVIPVDLVQAGHRAPDYRARNPQMLVPYLEDGDTGISQSQAIIEYLDERYDGPRLFPGDPAARAKVRAFAAAIACDIHPLNNLRVLKYLKGPLRASESAVHDWYAHWIQEGFHGLEAIAGDGPFALGDKPSAADLFLVPQMYNARRFNVDVSAFPKLVAIDELCLQLEAFAAAVPERQVDAP
jgi:maleylacetoacetate isomerase